MTSFLKEKNLVGPMAEVVIIGAGAAGIYTALALKKKGINTLILEKGKYEGASWRNMPKNLRLVSPPNSNKIDSFFISDYFSDYRMSALEFAKYLKEISQREKLDIKFDSKIESVEKVNSKFKLSFDSGEILETKYLINATGYYSNPFIPIFPGACKTKIKQIHFAEYKSVEEIGKDIKKILIVGKRLSAGQLISELSKYGKDIFISTRSPIEYTSGPLVFNLFLRFLNEIERMILFFKPHFKSEVPMEAADGKDLINSGRVISLKNIKEIGENEVHFENGHSEDFDMIIYATGFKACLGHFKNKKIENEIDLVDSFESRYFKNLFFIGLHNQRNFRSRFIRGIKDDVVELAKIIRSRMGN